MNPTREIVRFETNVPQIVALAFDKGLPVEGRFGDQVMYTLEGNRVAYFPPIVERKIQELGIRAHEPVEICKREVKSGNRRSLEWHVAARPDQQQPDEPPPPARTPEASPTKASNRESESTQGSAGRMTAQQHSTPSPNGQPHTPIPFGGSQQAQFFLSAMVNIVDIVIAVEDYAKAKGRDLNFTSEDIRALSISAFIQRERSAGGPR